MSVDRFVWDFKDIVISQCDKCFHWQNKGKCSAFPKGVPMDILTNDFIHTKKHPEQNNNILYEEITTNESK